MRVSIVVPVLNEAGTIGDSLRRLQREFPECDLVVVDGDSTDGTYEAAAAVARTIRSPRGRAVQMNTGAAACTGDVLWFIHADTAPDPAAYEQIRDAMADPRVVGGGLSLRFDRRTPSLHFLASASTARARRLHQIFGDQAMFIRRSVFDELVGFPLMPLMEDLEMSRRLHRRGRLVVLDATCMASARRFEQHGTVSMIAFMQWLKLQYYVGVPPDVLSRSYRAGPPWRRVGKREEVAV